MHSSGPPTKCKNREWVLIRFACYSVKVSFSPIYKAVSYTHLDVYKRQVQASANSGKEQKPQVKGKRQRLIYEKSEKQLDGSNTIKTEQSATDNSDTASGQSEGKAEKSEQKPSDSVPFDRVAKFEKKAEKARAKADKAEQDLPHKTKIKRKRLYDEQKQQTKTRLQFEKEVKPQSDLYHRCLLYTSRCV